MIVLLLSKTFFCLWCDRFFHVFKDWSNFNNQPLVCLKKQMKMVFKSFKIPTQKVEQPFPFWNLYRVIGRDDLFDTGIVFLFHHWERSNFANKTMWRLSIQLVPVNKSRIGKLRGVEGKMFRSFSLAKTWIYFTSYICTERFFNSLQLMYNKIFLKKNL